MSLELVRKCLAMQLEELEIISSIFCGPKEMVIDDPGIIVDMNNMINGTQEFLNRKLDYRVYLTLEGLKDRLEIFTELPHYYPSLELPSVTVSYPNISTHQHNLLKILVEDSLNSLRNTEETFLFSFIMWITDNLQVRNVLQNNLSVIERKSTNKTKEKPQEKKLQRLWIYSHHIKSKRKRSSIVENARDLQLTGFSLIGKPGIICVEGYQSDAQEFWRILKAMHWQRIQVRLEEQGSIEGTKAAADELAEFRKFNKFEETKFITANETGTTTSGGNGGGGGAGENDDDEDDDNSDQLNGQNNGEDNGEVLRLNMSTFSTFLDQHGCGHVMNTLFGFKG